MKKLLLLFSILFSINITHSQVVFCPPGAEWKYNFFNSAGGNPAYQSTSLETVKYVRDSVIGATTWKVLTHTNFYLECNFAPPMLTLIHQVGDTVFFQNQQTQHSRQILYNFNTSAGQSWQTSVLFGIPANSPTTFSFFVDSVKYVNINNFNLKRLFVRLNFPGNNYFIPFSITERTGSSNFLFNYYNNFLGRCDGTWFSGFLCYTDNQFGTKQFSAYPCNYENLLSVDKSIQNNQSYRILPNPASSSVCIVSGAEGQALKIRIIDISGRELKSLDIQNQSTVDVSNLNSGVYIVEVHNGENERYRTKFIKE